MVARPGYGYPAQLSYHNVTWRKYNVDVDKAAIGGVTFDALFGPIEMMDS